nr:uncharacterized protein LOC106732987 [Pelodiscus sinensis]|eukprot:XP_014436319.1 uncharacterized protein LOC106732987 [Pelodiscus sinensis]
MLTAESDKQPDETARDQPQQEIDTHSRHQYPCLPSTSYSPGRSPSRQSPPRSMSPSSLQDAPLPDDDCHTVYSSWHALPRKSRSYHYRAPPQQTPWHPYWPYPPPPYPLQWGSWDHWEPYRHRSPACSTPSQRSLPRPQPLPPASLSEEEVEWISDNESDIHSVNGKPDDAVVPSDTVAIDDLKQFQELFKRAATSQHVSLQEVQKKQYQLLKNLHPTLHSKIALPIDEAIMETSEDLWKTPTSIQPTYKKIDRKYFIPSKDFLFMHPQPNSLVVDSAQQRAKFPQ